MKPFGFTSTLRCAALFLASLAFSLIASGQPVGNGGLEKWQMGSVQMPDSFVTSDVGDPIGSVTRSTDAHSGQYAALIKSTNTAFGPHSGGIWYAFYDAGISLVSYWPVNGRPTRLSFWYKYSRQGNDTAVVIVELTRWKNGSRGPAGSAYYLITSNVSGYTQAFVPIIPAADQPDSVRIGFLSSNLNPVVGSTLYVDDIALEYGTGIKNATGPDLLHLFPNPATEKFTMEMPQESDCIVEVSNAIGSSVYREKHTGRKVSVDCNDWSSGIYFVTVRCSEKIYSGKFLRQ